MSGFQKILYKKYNLSETNYSRIDIEVASLNGAERTGLVKYWKNTAQVWVPTRHQVWMHPADIHRLLSLLPKVAKDLLSLPSQGENAGRQEAPAKEPREACPGKTAATSSSKQGTNSGLD